VIYNATTKHLYSAKNYQLLAQAMETKGWPTGEFAGFRQWLAVGRVVRKGEHGTPIMMMVDKAVTASGVWFRELFVVAFVVISVVSPAANAGRTSFTAGIDGTTPLAHTPRFRHPSADIQWIKEVTRLLPGYRGALVVKVAESRLAALCG
jgi:hypothetical protein